MKRNIDYSKLNKNSIAAVLTDDVIKMAYKKTTTKDVYALIKNLFEKNNIDTEYSRKLLNNIYKCKHVEDAWMAIFNVAFVGTGGGRVSC